MPVKRGLYVVDKRTLNRISGPFDINDWEHANIHCSTENSMAEINGREPHACVMREWEIVEAWERENDSLL